jgi:hypothetical protein
MGFEKHWPQRGALPFGDPSFLNNPNKQLGE